MTHNRRVHIRQCDSAAVLFGTIRDDSAELKDRMVHLLPITHSHNCFHSMSMGYNAFRAEFLTIRPVRKSPRQRRRRSLVFALSDAGERICSQIRQTPSRQSGQESQPTLQQSHLHEIVAAPTDNSTGVARGYRHAADRATNCAKIGEHFVVALNEFAALIARSSAHFNRSRIAANFANKSGEFRRAIARGRADRQRC